MAKKNNKTLMPNDKEFKILNHFTITISNDIRVPLKSLKPIRKSKIKQYHKVSLPDLKPIYEEQYQTTTLKVLL